MRRFDTPGAPAYFVLQGTARIPSHAAGIALVRARPRGCLTVMTVAFLPPPAFYGRAFTRYGMSVRLAPCRGRGPHGTGRSQTARSSLQRTGGGDLWGASLCCEPPGRTAPRSVTLYAETDAGRRGPVALGGTHLRIRTPRVTSYDRPRHQKGAGVYRPRRQCPARASTTGRESPSPGKATQTDWSRILESLNALGRDLEEINTALKETNELHASPIV